MCLTGDTLIPSSLGLVRFDYLHEKIAGDRFGWTHEVLFKEPLEVATRNGSRRVTDLFRAFSPITHIETQDGDTLKIVEDHPILTLVDSRPLFQPPVLLELGQWVGKPYETQMFAIHPIPTPSWEISTLNDWERLVHGVLGKVQVETPMLGQICREDQLDFLKVLFLSFGSRCPVSHSLGVRVGTREQANLLKTLMQNLGIQSHLRPTRESFWVNVKPISYQKFNSLLGFSWAPYRNVVDEIPVASLLREYIRRLTILCSQNAIARWSLIDKVDGARWAYRYACEKIPRILVLKILEIHLDTPIENLVEADLAFLRHLLWQSAVCSWAKLIKIERKVQPEPTFDLRVEGYPEYTGNGIIVQ